jgi:CDP-glycerol glycerophosphotransferase (TagB/SpsB family)
MSNYLHKLGKNIRLFITSAKPEYRSILTNDYLYSEKEIILTGLPRFDKLENNTKKEILIMPTWRSTLALPRDRYGLRKKNPAFIESKYYKFYNSLIHHPKLIKYAQKFGYKIILHLHPEFIQYADEFYGNSITKVDKKICNYSKAFSHGCLLVTDYSSTVFDFVYLRKPVIYTQFDKEDIFNTHTYKKGYFDYKDDGFGPVCKDLDSTIDTIIKILENDCKLEDKYRRRIDNFFEYDDKNNCERVYKSIKELD